MFETLAVGSVNSGDSFLPQLDAGRYQFVPQLRAFTPHPQAIFNFKSGLQEVDRDHREK